MTCLFLTAELCSNSTIGNSSEQSELVSYNKRDPAPCGGVLIFYLSSSIHSSASTLRGPRQEEGESPKGGFPGGPLINLGRLEHCGKFGVVPSQFILPGWEGKAEVSDRSSRARSTWAQQDRFCGECIPPDFIIFSVEKG